MALWMILVVVWLTGIPMVLFAMSAIRLLIPPRRDQSSRLEALGQPVGTVVELRPGGSGK